MRNLADTGEVRLEMTGQAHAIARADEQTAVPRPVRPVAAHAAVPLLCGQVLEHIRPGLIFVAGEAGRFGLQAARQRNGIAAVNVVTIDTVDKAGFDRMPVLKLELGLHRRVALGAKLPALVSPGVTDIVSWGETVPGAAAVAAPAADGVAVGAVVSRREVGGVTRQAGARFVGRCPFGKSLCAENVRRISGLEVPSSISMAGLAESYPFVDNTAMSGGPKGSVLLLVTISAGVLG